MCRNIWLITIFILFFFNSIRSQDLEARSYSVVPKGMHAAALSYTYTSGNIITDFSSPIQNLKVNTSIVNLGYVQTFSLFNKMARIQVAQPYGFLNGSATVNGADTTASRNGFFDTKIKFGMNLFGSPVLTPKEFRLFQEHTVLGASLVISVPTGQYLKEKLINLGTNRWGFKPEIGFSHREGRLYFELYSGVWFFTNNNEYLKNKSLDQQPLITLQTHVDYVFKSSMWVAVNAGVARGGESAINGVENDDQQRNWRAGATFSMPLNKHQSVKAMFNTGVTTRAGQNYTAFTLIYQYIWF